MEEEAVRRFEAAWDAHGAAVYRLAMVYLGRAADAEDVTQEVFCRLLDRAPDFAGGEHEKRWLLRVTANLCRNQLKGAWRQKTAALEADLPARDPEDRGGVGGGAGPAGDLPSPHPSALLRGLLRISEVAALLRLTPSAVKMRLKRGREMLKLELGEEAHI